VRNERGASAVEYALLAIAVAVIASVLMLFRDVIIEDFDEQACQPSRGFDCRKYDNP